MGKGSMMAKSTGGSTGWDRFDPIKAQEDATRRLVGNYDEWIKWPILPMKNIKTGAYKKDGLGIMTEEDSDTYNIYLMSMFQNMKDIDKVEVLKYSSVDSLIDAGWRVD